MTTARVPRVLALGCLAVLLAAGCSRRPVEPAAPARPAAVSAPAAPATSLRDSVSLGGAAAYAALAAGDSVTVRSRPAAGKAVDLIPPKLVWGTPTPFLVREARRVDGQLWYRVLLPKRPNESSGWVRGDQLQVVPRSYRVLVDLSEHRVSLYKDGKLVRSFPAGIGRPSTPTPAGRFFVTVKLRAPQISSVYGAWALGLSGYSQVLNQFGTGDGQIAIHGTSNPADLGRQISNGCVRLDNAAVTVLADLLEPGSPVDIQA